MGKLEEEKPLHCHFNHEHPLELTNLAQTSQVTCSGCCLDVDPGRDYYTCRTCPFSLHPSCFNLPRKIRHPADPNHDLILICSPSFECRACGALDSGFSYNCEICVRNYHSLCTVFSLSIYHHSHQHPLKLEFSPPYDGIKGFRCDICRAPGSDHWLYRCGACEFDAHLNCANSNQKPQTQTEVSSKPASEAGSSSGMPQTGASGAYLSQGDNYSNDQNSTVGSSTSTFRSLPSTTQVNQRNSYPNRVQTQPNGNNFNPSGVHGINQSGFVQQHGLPMAAQAPANQGFGYGNQMSVGSNQGAMSGMKGMLVGGMASGMGQAVVQEIVHSAANGWGDGGVSLGDDGGQDILDCWIGDSDYH